MEKKYTENVPSPIEEYCMGWKEMNADIIIDCLSVLSIYEDYTFEKITLHSSLKSLHEVFFNLLKKSSLFPTVVLYKSIRDNNSKEHNRCLVDIETSKGDLIFTNSIVYSEDKIVSIEVHENKLSELLMKESLSGDQCLDLLLGLIVKNDQGLRIIQYPSSA